MVATKTARILTGQPFTWSVSAEGFTTQSGSVASVTGDINMSIYLLGEMNAVKKVTSMSGSTWYLTEDGQLYGCGSNYSGQQGIGTSGSGTNVTEFTKRAENVKDFFLRRSTIWYLTESGDLYACGYNSTGQQGSGDTSIVTTFTKRAENVKAFYASDGYGSTSWYITNDGDLYGCGAGTNGCQGSGNTSNVTSFTKRGTNVKKVVPIYANSVGCTWYLTEDGDLYGCGWGGDGQQGSGNTSDVTTFTKRASNVKDVFASTETTWYIDSNDDLYGTGYAAQGQQGYGSTTKVLEFTKRASGVKEVFCNDYITQYITNDGTFYSCGSNEYRQQGSGGSSNVTSFVQRGTGAKKIYSYRNVSAYVTNSGDLYLCGQGDSGQQGSGGTSDVSSFTKRGENVDVFATTNSASYYVNTNGDLYICGLNSSGQQGSGNTTDVTSFTKRAENVKTIEGMDFYTSASWYITNSGDLYGCGAGTSGEQGSGSTSNVTQFSKRFTGSVNTATLSISSTPADATITINGKTASSLAIQKGLPVEWTVSATGYITKTGTIDHIYADISLSVILESA